MGIPVGKLALYTAGAGIYPAHTLPVSLDVGTDNEDLLADPLYIGYRQRRLRGAEYDDFIEAFVAAILDVCPRAVLQWEDFKQHNAIRILDRYRHRITSFNDDIQGTGAVVLAGILAAVRALGRPLGEQRFVFLGAGRGRHRHRPHGSRGDERRGRGRPRRSSGRSSPWTRRASSSPTATSSTTTSWSSPSGRTSWPRYGLGGLEPADRLDLEAVVAAVKPTILIGTSGVAGAFTERAIREMAAHADRPVIFPLSNPTTKTEAVPADIMAWTGGRALDRHRQPVRAGRSVDGRTHLIGQANNVFIFPGVGLGAIVAEAREITDEMFLLAARTLAEMVSPERLAAGALYPAVSELRERLATDRRRRSSARVATAASAVSTATRKSSTRSTRRCGSPTTCRTARSGRRRPVRPLPAGAATWPWRHQDLQVGARIGHRVGQVDRQQTPRP